MCVLHTSALSHIAEMVLLAALNKSLQKLRCTFKSSLEWPSGSVTLRTCVPPTFHKKNLSALYVQDPRGWARLELASSCLQGLEAEACPKSEWGGIQTKACRSWQEGAELGLSWLRGSEHQEGLFLPSSVCPSRWAGTSSMVQRPSLPNNKGRKAVPP